MLSAREVRAWLLIQPRPTRIRVHCESGDIQEIKTPSHPNWATIGKTVEALEPTLLEACDTEGALIRAVRCEDDPDDQGDDDDCTTTKRGADTIRAPAVLANDPQAALLGYFADLLARAHAHTDQAFDKLLALVERVEQRDAARDDRLERLERLYRRSVQDQIDATLDAAAREAGAGNSNADPLQAMASAFMGGIMRGQQQQAPAQDVKPNGKGKAQ